MPLYDNRVSGGTGGVQSVNGDTGPAVVITAASIGAESSTPTQVDCLDNATEQIVIGTTAANEKYEISYVLKLNVSGKKRTGKAILSYDPVDGVIFDDHYEFITDEISGLDISGNESGGNLRIAVDLNSVGENSKFRYTTKVITPVV